MLRCEGETRRQETGKTGGWTISLASGEEARESFRIPSTAWGTSSGVSQFTGRVPRPATFFFSWSYSVRVCGEKKKDKGENVDIKQQTNSWGTICTT